MARFDVHRRSGEIGFIIDCQADILRGLNTRVVVPLLPPDIAPLAGQRLNPTFEIDGEPYVMVTQFLSSIPDQEMGPMIASLAEEHSQIMNAIDMLLTGY